MLSSCDDLSVPVNTAIIYLKLPIIVDSTICSADFAPSIVVGASGHYFSTVWLNLDSGLPHVGAAECLIDGEVNGLGWHHHRMRKTRVSSSQLAGLDACC